MPVNPAFASLNLAQTVLLTAYEWRRQGGDIPAERLEGEQTEPANAQAVGKLYEYLGAQRPVVCIGSPTGDSARIVKETGAGLVADFQEEELSLCRGAV